jgi:hypothetical protein
MMVHPSKHTRDSLRWLVDRIRYEYYAPTRPWSAAGINAFLDTRAGLVRLFKSRATNPTAVYDLRYCANTFDFAYYLYDAETYFRDMGFDRFQVCILDKELSGLGDYDNIIGWDKRRKRVQAILVPMAEMYQGCSLVRVLDDADELIAFCNDNEPIFPRHVDGRHLRSFRYEDIYRKLARGIPFSGFRAPQSAVDQALRLLQRKDITRPIVTLTVRAYGYQPLRNTDMQAYFLFAGHLRSKGFAPIFIPDADAPDSVDFGEFPSCKEVCSDLALRTALYEEAFTNIFTSNGVHAMAAFNNKCSFVLALLNEQYETNTSLKRWESEGLMLGDQPFGGTTKHFIWAKETFENLCRYFEIVRLHRPIGFPSAQRLDSKDF